MIFDSFIRHFNQLIHEAKKIFLHRVNRIAIAYSGGKDSTVLLHLLSRYIKTHDIELIALHINHGLSDLSDDWSTHVQQVCEQEKIAFFAQKICLHDNRKKGIEASAREARYHALGELCHQHKVDILCTAHHQDDQAETILLQILRGTGLKGLCGMLSYQEASQLLQQESIIMMRPLLIYSQQVLMQYATQHHLQYIEDESNHDTRYTRNWLRHDIIPLLVKRFPHFQQHMMKMSEHLQASYQLLMQSVKEDYQACSHNNNLQIARLRCLEKPQLYEVWRYWLQIHHLSMPSQAKLMAMIKQFVFSKDDAQPRRDPCITVTSGVKTRRPDTSLRSVLNVHEDCEHRATQYFPRAVSYTGVSRMQYEQVELYAYRGEVSIHAIEPFISASHETFYWKGEEKLDFPLFGGSLYFEKAKFGCDSNWLKKQVLTIGYRQGGEN